MTKSSMNMASPTSKCRYREKNEPCAKKWMITTIHYFLFCRAICSTCALSVKLYGTSGGAVDTWDTSGGAADTWDTSAVATDTRDMSGGATDTRDMSGGATDTRDTSGQCFQ